MSILWAYRKQLAASIIRRREKGKKRIFHPHPIISTPILKSRGDKILLGQQESAPSRFSWLPQKSSINFGRSTLLQQHETTITKDRTLWIQLKALRIVTMSSSSSLVLQGADADNGTLGATGMFFALSMRTERPIEGCEVLAHPFLFLKGGTLDNASRAKVMDNNPHKFKYRWFRGPVRQLCQFDNCPRGSTYDPVAWSKPAVGGASLQCAVCAKAGVAGHHSLFCSAR